MLILQQRTALPAWLSPAMLGTLALGHLVGAWRVRQLYTHALVKMLEERDFSSLIAGEATLLSAADLATLRLLCDQFEQTDNTPDFAIFVAQLLIHIGDRQAVPILDAAVRRATDPYLRASLVDVLVAGEADHRQVHRLYADLLNDPAPWVRRSALSGLARLHDPRLTSFALALLNDADTQVRVSALTILAHTGDFYGHPAALDTLEALLESDDTEQRAQGLPLPDSGW